jgi:hypothetical protein
MRGRFTILLATALLLVGTTATAQDAELCTFTGVDTEDFGAGCGFLAPPVLTIDFTEGDCTLDFAIDAPTCCNTFVTGHWLLVGTGLPTPAGLNSPPFLPGCQLWVDPFLVIGPLPLTSTSIVLPPILPITPITVQIQAVPVFFTTIGMSTDLGTTQGVDLTLIN